MISILIVDDDINKISSIITAIHDHYKGQIDIMQASNVQEAIEVLQNNHFHLLVSDLFMPIRPNERPNEKGGDTLIRELYKRKNKINVPIYIVGLSQFEEVKHNFSGVWKVWLYDISSLDWQLKLRDLVFHIEKINSKIIKEKKATIFVEGATDKDIISLAFNLFFRSHTNQVIIETRTFGGGASWVERQLVIWAKSLFCKNGDNYLKAVGLFDNDEAGLKAIESIKKQIVANSAEDKTFSTLKLDRKYASHLINSYLEGFLLPITLEELYAPSCWRHAQKQNWLVNRALTKEILRDFQKWAETGLSFNDYWKSLSISETVNLYVNYEVNENHKVDFVKYIKQLPEQEQIEALSAFRPLIEDLLSKLKLL